MTHVCKQNAKILFIFGLMTLFLVLVGYSANQSRIAAQQSADVNRKIAEHGVALNRLDGNDRDVAAMGRDLEWIKQTLNEIKEKLK